MTRGVDPCRLRGPDHNTAERWQAGRKSLQTDLYEFTNKFVFLFSRLYFHGLNMLQDDRYLDATDAKR
jgi:hypothetical protein